MSPNTQWPAAAAALLLVLLSAESPAGAQGPDCTRVPVLIELFTSEGCSSCPPADEVLARMIAEQPVPGVEVIGMSERVDYWDRLGWKDPYSDAGFTARQREYARVFDRSGLYTPQAVIDGRAEFVGSDLVRAMEAASQARRSSKADIGLEKMARTATGVTLAIWVARLTMLGRDGSADIYLALTENNLGSDVTGGENQGRRLTHAAVVRRMSKAGRVTGAGSFTSRSVVSIPAVWKREDVRAVVFAQDAKTRRILGASSISLN